VTSEYSEKESQFVNTDGTVQMDLPVDQLLLQTKDVDPNFEWVCIKASFIRSNPVLPVSDQFFLADSYSSQISTLDNLGHRHLETDTGFTNLEATPYSVFFGFDFTNTNFYSDG